MMTKKHIGKNGIKFINERLIEKGYFSLEQIIKKFGGNSKKITDYIFELEEEKIIKYNKDEEVYVKINHTNTQKQYSYSKEMAETKEKISKEDLKFLNKLEKELHSIEDIKLPKNRGTGKMDEYKRRKINSEEMKKLKEIIDTGKYVFFLKNGPFGFYPCFELSSFNQIYSGAIEKKHLLSFSIGQLPKGESFETMSKYFMDQRNIERANIVGIKFENDQSQYDY